MTDALKVHIRRPAMKKDTSRSVEMRAVVKIQACGKSARTVSDRPDYQAVVGLDVGDRRTHYCVLDLDGKVAFRRSVATREASLRIQFEGSARMRIALEAGTPRRGSAECCWDGVTM